MTTAETLLSKFGAKGCISRAKAICEQKYGEMLRFERVHGEYLKSHCNPKYAAYRDGDATVRSGICLDEFKYAEDAIVAAALTMYIEAMGKHAKGESRTVERRKRLSLREIAYEVFDVCKKDLTDATLETKAENFEFGHYKVMVAAWLDEGWSNDKRYDFIVERLNDRFQACRSLEYLPRVIRDTVMLLRERGMFRVEQWEKTAETVADLLRKWKQSIVEK